MRNYKFQNRCILETGKVVQIRYNNCQSWLRYGNVFIYLFSGETCQDAEIQTDAKRIKIVSRKPPTRFSLRLAQLDKDLSQINK